MIYVCQQAEKLSKEYFNYLMYTLYNIKHEYTFDMTPKDLSELHNSMMLELLLTYYMATHNKYTFDLSRSLSSSHH